MEKQNNITSEHIIQKDDKIHPINSQKINIDLVALLLLISHKWKFISITILIWAIVGIWYAFQQPKEYRSTVMLAPETTSNNLASKISSVTSMVGLFDEANPTGDAIYPEIYPEMMSSNDFLVKLLPVQVKTLDNKVHTNYFDYKKNKTKKTLLMKMRGGIEIFFSSLSKKENIQHQIDSLHPNPHQLTKEEDGIVNSMRSDFTCQVDKKTNVITISAQTEDPLVSTIMANAIKDELQKFITKYKTEKSRNDVKYMSEINQKAKLDYSKARQRYAAYCDANTDVTLESIKSKQEDLENDMQLKYNIYTQTMQQLQMSMATLQDNTPAFTTIQSATVPLKHCNTPKIFILAVFLILGMISDLLFIAIRYRKNIIQIV